jgi:hypothetical protein
MRKEYSSTLGTSDISFIPKDNTHILMFIELKVNSTPKDAIN